MAYAGKGSSYSSGVKPFISIRESIALKSATFLAANFCQDRDIKRTLGNEIVEKFYSAL